MTYPQISDLDFYKKILNKKEFAENSITNVMKKLYCYQPQQRFLANYMSPKTPYHNILVFHEVGTGKTLSSIAIAESNKEANIFVFCKNMTLISSYKNQLIRGCEKYGTIQNIPNRYSFHTYKDFDIFSKGFPENSVVIVDEAHNIISDNSTEKILTCIDNSNPEKTKIVMLSGTPMYDKVQQIFEILNFLVPVGQRVTITDGLVKKNSLTPEGIIYLEKMAKGIISYLKIDKKTFATECNIFLNLEMSSFQARAYTQIQSSTLEMDKTAAAMIVYPKEIFHVKELYGDFLAHQNLKNHSIKLYTLLNKLKTTKGKSIVYSNFVSKSCGINIIKAVFDYNSIKYILISEEMKNDKFKEIHRFVYGKNEPEILLCSSIISEGLNTKGVYNVHILDPHWNDSRLQQVIGRAIRQDSHPKGSKVYVFKYIATIQGIETIDQYKYKIARNKKLGIDVATKILNRVAVDCWLNKKRNGNEACVYEPRGQIQLDYSTFVIDTIKFNFVKEKIIELFKLNVYLTFGYIIDRINNTDIIISEEELNQTLDLIQSEQLKIQGPFNLPGYLFRKQDFIIFSRVSEKFVGPLNNKAIQVQMENTGPMSSMGPINSKASKVPKTASKKKIDISYFEKFELPLLGHYLNKFGENDNQLRILDFTEIDPTEEDNRKISIGKKLNTYSLEELVELLKKTEIPLPQKEKKKWYIDTITQYFIDNKLIV